MLERYHVFIVSWIWKFELLQRFLWSINHSYKTIFLSVRCGLYTNATGIISMQLVKRSGFKVSLLLCSQKVGGRYFYFARHVSRQIRVLKRVANVPLKPLDDLTVQYKHGVGDRSTLTLRKRSFSRALVSLARMKLNTAVRAAGNSSSKGQCAVGPRTNVQHGVAEPLVVQCNWA